MGIRIDGASDLINATDGSLTVDGLSINVTGIVTASSGFQVGSAATIHSTGQINSTNIVVSAGSSIGIGTDNPDTLLHVYKSGVHGGLHANSDAPLIVENNGNCVIDIASIHTGIGGVYFSDTGASGKGKIEYKHGDDYMTFQANGSERLRITSTGKVGINTDSPEGTLSVDGSIAVSSSSDTVTPSGYDIKIRSTTSKLGIHCVTSGGTPILEFGTGGSTGCCIFNADATPMRLGTVNTERMRIRGDGRISIGSSLAVTGVCTAAAFVPSEGQLSNRRININGAMQVWQRSTSASDIGGSNGYFACDRYRSSNNGAGRHTISRDTDEPGGFNYSMKIDVTTAVASPSANNYMFIQHRMEGSDVQPFAKGTSSAQKYALSFWVKSPKTGVHVVQLEDVENSRSVQGIYTIASANTWENHSIIFPAETSNGISGDNAHRMQLYFWLFAGSTYNDGNVNSLGTTWASTGSISRASGQVNCFDNTSNNFYITGIQLEVGSYATPFEHALYSDELLRCQRYYYVVADGTDDASYPGMGLGTYYSSSTFHFFHHLPVEMRAEPTGEVDTTTGNYGIYSAGNGGDSCEDFSVVGNSTKRMLDIYANSGVSGTAGDAGLVRVLQGTGRIAVHAEL